MKNLTPILLVISVLAFTNCDTLKQTAGQMATDAINQQMGGNSKSKPILSKDDAIKGLKEALVVGVNKGTDRLGAVGAFSVFSANDLSVVEIKKRKVTKIAQSVRFIPIFLSSEFVEQRWR